MRQLSYRPWALAVGFVAATSLTRLLPLEQPIKVGQTFRLPQLLTGFAYGKDEDEARWAIVVAAPDGAVSAWLLPRSASKASEVEVPASSADGFSKDGWAYFRPRQIEMSKLHGYEYGGVLDSATLANVMAFYRLNREQEAEERRVRRMNRTAHRRRGSGRGPRL